MGCTFPCGWGKAMSIKATGAPPSPALEVADILWRPTWPPLISRPRGDLNGLIRMWYPLPVLQLTPVWEWLGERPQGHMKPKRLEEGDELWGKALVPSPTLLPFSCSREKGLVIIWTKSMYLWLECFGISINLVLNCNTSLSLSSPWWMA